MRDIRDLKLKAPIYRGRNRDWSLPCIREWRKGASARFAGHGRDENPWSKPYGFRRANMGKFEWAWWQGHDACALALGDKLPRLLPLRTPKKHKAAAARAG